MTTSRALVGAAMLLATLGGCASLGGDVFADQDPDVRAYAVLAENGFTGDVAFMLPGQQDTIYHGETDASEAAVRTVEGWPWASVTKQVTAVLVMREVEDGTISLGSDVGRWIPALEGRELTVEDLLRHRSDLPNPDDTAVNENGFPSFYSGEQAPLAYCTGQGLTVAAGSMAYNNCDYIVLGAMLERVTDSSLDLLLAQGIGLEAGWINTGFLQDDSDRPFAARTEEVARNIAGYGASGALVGPLDDMLAFNRALMDGRLLGEAALGRLWYGDPANGYMALGQWVFDAPLQGCGAPVRIVERRGAIGDYQVRNIMLPGRQIAIALATDQPQFDFGEIWTGEGVLHDMLSQAVCD